MKWCSVGPNGQINQMGTVSGDVDESTFAHIPELIVTNVPPDVTEGTHYFNSGVFKPFGEKPSAYSVWDWSTHKWRLSATALDDTKKAQSALIDAACREAICAGFKSSALGAEYHYPAKTQDQANLVASVTASLYPGLPAEWATPFWCADAQGVWNYTDHTARQIQQAGADGKAAITEALSKNESLQRAILAAQTIQDVQQVVWINTQER